MSKAIRVTTVHGHIVELDPQHVIGLRQFEVANDENTVTVCELLVTGGYTGIAIVGTIEQVNAQLRRVALAPGIVVPRT